MDNKAMDSPNKMRYRQEVWNIVDIWLKNLSRARRRVVYLDTSLALETEFLLARNYRPENLTPVNFSAAQVAAINVKFPKVHGKAGNLLSMNRQAFHVVHFDSTTTLAGLRRNPITSYPGQIFIANIIGGRERSIPSLQKLVSQLGGFPGAFSQTIADDLAKHPIVGMTLLDQVRLYCLQDWVLGEPSNSVNKHRQGRYLGGTLNNFPMLWSMTWFRPARLSTKFGILLDTNGHRVAAMHAR